MKTKTKCLMMGFFSLIPVLIIWFHLPLDKMLKSGLNDLRYAPVLILGLILMAYPLYYSVCFFEAYIDLNKKEAGE